MTACQGNMFVLVNVSKHRDLMGDIVQQLVSQYGVPISIVDNIQKICPKCSSPAQIDQDCTSSTSSTTAQNSEERVEDVTPKIIAKPVHNPVPTQTPTPTPLKRRESPLKEQKILEVKKIRVEEPVKEPTVVNVKQEMITIEEDDESSVFGTMLAALRNGNTDSIPRNNSGPSSDDGASNSSNIYDADDDDYKSAPWANPDFLTNFITSQPNIFSGTCQQDSNGSPPKTQNQGTRQVPPMLTVNGKTRRGRIVYTPNELNILEKYYEEDPNACADMRKRDLMCKALSIDYHRLKVWFQNRRRKDKVRSQEEAASSFNGHDFAIDS